MTISSSQAQVKSSTSGSARAQAVVRYIPLIVLVALLVLLIVRNPKIIQPANLQSIAVYAVPSALCAIGLALVIAVMGDDVMSGGIDLSLPSQAVFSAAIIALLLVQGIPFIAAFTVGIVAVLLVGVLNGLLIERLGMMPILATLATSVFVGGVTRAVTTNRRIEVDDSVIILLRDGKLLGISLSVLTAIALTAIASVLFHHTSFGIRVQAVGGNRELAARSGVKPSHYIVAAFLIASLLSAFASLFLLSRASGWSTGSEDQLLLDMLLAGYLAPVFSRQSLYTPVGAALGALITSALSNALVLSGVDNSLIDGAKGVLILLVVGACALRKD